MPRSGMTPKTRSPAEKSVVWNTMIARTSSASRSRGSQVTVGPPGAGSSTGRRPQHLDVVEMREVDQRPDENVLLEVTVGPADPAHGADRNCGRERAVRLARGVDDLALGHLGVGIDELGAHCAAVASTPDHAARAALLDPDTDARLGVLDQQHGGAVA